MEKFVVGKDNKPLMARRVQFDSNRPDVNEHRETGKVNKTLDQEGLVNDVNDTKEPNGVVHVSSLENKEGSLEKNKSKPSFFAYILQNNTSDKTVKLQKLHNIDCVEGADVTILIEAVEEVSARFANTLFGYFIGKRLAFPLVENYVKNTWAKFGLKRVMLQNGFFFFQFATNEGMEKVIENGPWLIRLVPLILNTFVEVSADKELMDSLVVDIPFPNGKGYSLETIEIEYEWEPPRKRVKSKARPKRKIEGVRLSKPKPNFYYRLKSAHAVGETSSKQANEKSGDKGTNQVTNNMSTTNVSNNGPASISKELEQMPLKNSFAAPVDEADPTQPCNEDNEANNLGSDEDESDSEVIETNVLEEPRFMGGKMKSNESKGASTHSNDVLNDDQVMHARVWFKGDKKELFFSFIYAHNHYTHRHTLWNSLCLQKHYVRNRPWCLLGDFNAALNLADHLARSSNIDISMREFKDCVEEIPRSTTVIPKPFKFSNILIYNVRFKDVVKDGWDLPDSGFYMFQVQSDLDLDPSNNILREEEPAYVLAFNEALIVEETFLKQKANIEWLRVGDSNSAYFHKAVKGRVSRSRIDVVYDSNGPDGYTTAFCKEAWDVVANDVTRVVQEFFTNGKLLKDLNHTIIALIPKIEAPPGVPLKLIFRKLMIRLIGGFLKQTLMGFGFHDRMIHWIMECVTSTSFSLSFNGVLHGYFKGQHGLRQGDPMSPYLFALIMEILTLMLQRRVREDDSFTYHRYCDKLDIINLCFMDDLFFFSHEDADSTQVIMGALDEFKLASGLTPSLPNTTAYFCNVLNHTKLSILNILPFEEGHLPVKYLGVSLISSRLIYQDCRELIEKVQNRDMRRGKAKVAWEVVCLPKKEGGIFVGEMLQAYKLKGQNFGDVLIRGNMAWGWRKVLQIRPIIREFIWYRIGDGSKTWPHDWISKYLALATIVVPNIIYNAVDELEWRNSSGTAMDFSVSSVWECIFPRGDEITWCDVVWNHMKIYAGTPRVAASLNAIIDHIIPMSKKKTTKSVIVKLVFAASTYFIISCSRIRRGLLIRLSIASRSWFDLSFSRVGIWSEIPQEVIEMYERLHLGSTLVVLFQIKLLPFPPMSNPFTLCSRVLFLWNGRGWERKSKNNGVLEFFLRWKARDGKVGGREIIGFWEGTSSDSRIVKDALTKDDKLIIPDDRDKELENEVIDQMLAASHDEEPHGPRDTDDRGEQIINSIANDIDGATKNETDVATTKNESFSWNEQMDAAFIEAMLKEQNAGNRPNETFSPHAYNNMVKALRVALSSYAWNSSTRLIEAEDDVWEALKKQAETVEEIDHLFDNNVINLDNIGTSDVIHVSSPTTQSDGKLPTKSKSKKRKVVEEDPSQDKIANSFDNIVHALDRNSKIVLSERNHGLDDSEDSDTRG
nr:hypothetical protein [Tanacetum cinerariifolium]